MATGDNFKQLLEGPIIVSLSVVQKYTLKEVENKMQKQN